MKSLLIVLALVLLSGCSDMKAEFLLMELNSKSEDACKFKDDKGYYGGYESKKRCRENLPWRYAQNAKLAASTGLKYYRK